MIDMMRTPKASALASISTLSAQPPHGFDENEDREAEEKGRFDQGGERLDLGVAVVMLLVGRFAGGADRVIGDDRDAGIDEIVTRLGEQSQRTRRKAGDKFGEG